MFVAKKSVAENLGRFEQIPVYRGARLGRFHSIYVHTYVANKGTPDMYVHKTTQKGTHPHTRSNTYLPQFALSLAAGHILRNTKKRTTSTMTMDRNVRTNTQYSQYNCTYIRIHVRTYI